MRRLTYHLEGVQILTVSLTGVTPAVGGIRTICAKPLQNFKTILVRVFRALARIVGRIADMHPPAPVTSVKLRLAQVC